MLCALTAAIVLASAGLSTGATGTSVVSATVPSASWVDTGSCATGTASVTDFGTVLPGSSAVTANDCTITFGSSNDTSMLRTYQTDGRGYAMFRPTDGSLDTAGFNATGRYDLNLGGIEEFNDVAVQPDGKIVVVGTTGTGAAANILVARFLPSGTLDTAGFGSPNGYVTTNIANEDRGIEVELPGDGSIIVAGTSNSSGTRDFALVKYLSTGVRDTANFGNPNGWVRQSITANDDNVDALTIAPDGSILVGGQHFGANFNSIIARFSASGVLDTGGFNNPLGYHVFNNGTNNEWGNGIGVQPDGKIIFVGEDGNGDLRIQRYLPTGLLDTAGFNSPNGYRYVDAGGTDRAYAMLMQTDGTFYVTGMHQGNMGASRHNLDGTLDTTWNAPNGYAFAVQCGWDRAFGIAQQPDGNLVAAGRSACATDQWGVVRVGAAGADTSYFNRPTGGKLFDTSAAAQPDEARGIAVDADGRVIMVGISYNGANADATVMALAGTPVSQYDDPLDDDWATAGKNLFGACLRSVANGATAGAGAWTVGPGNACTAGDGAHWNAIPAASPGSKVAYTSVPDAQGGATDPTVTLRFGFRTKADQPPGRYVAPITFDVIAPNA